MSKRIPSGPTDNQPQGSVSKGFASGIWIFEKCTLGRAFSFEKFFLAKKKLIIKVENDGKDFTKKVKLNFFSENMMEQIENWED